MGCCCSPGQPRVQHLKIHLTYYVPLSTAVWRTFLLMSTVHLSLHEGFMAKIIGQSQLNTSVSDQLWGYSLAALSDLLQWWQMPDKPLSHNEIHLNCFLWHRNQADPHAKPPPLEARQGPATTLQTRRLCLASWQISEALTYPKYALAHMWQQRCVRWASTPARFTARPKKHGRTRYLWSFLTESRNSINAARYQAFQLSLSIYSCSIQQRFERGQYFTQLMRKF